jgi:hypothetical protein
MLPVGAVASVMPKPSAPCKVIVCVGVSEKYSSALLSDVPVVAALRVRRERTFNSGIPDGGPEYVVSVTVPLPTIVGSVIAPLIALADGKVTDAGAGFAENVAVLLGPDGVCVLCGVAVGPLVGPGVIGGVPPPPPHAARKARIASVKKRRRTRYCMQHCYAAQKADSRLHDERTCVPKRFAS